MKAAFLILLATCSALLQAALPTDEGELRELGKRRKAEILATRDTVPPVGADVRYVSPDGNDSADGKSPSKAWKTVGRVNEEKLDSGAFVRFRRGATYRGSVATRSGVTYGAWGEGDKPVLCVSPENGASAAKWRKTAAKNIWSYHIGHDDVGTLVFDGGKEHAIKIVIRTDRKTDKTFNKFTGRPFISYRDLDSDLHFWHDYYKDGTGNLYLYSEVNPGIRFKSIEFNVKSSGFRIGSNHDVTIDNFTVRHAGIHGVAAGTCTNLCVRNCCFEWIGGSIQAENIFNRDHPTRYGNGVEIYGGCENYVVSNCWFDQIYDAGVTHQFNVKPKWGSRRFDQRHVRYIDNVMRHCNYAIEYFLTSPNGNQSTMDDILFERNLMFDSGLGFCQQRPDHTQASAIKAWYPRDRNRARNFIIRNNAVVRSSENLIQISCGLKNADGSSSLPTMTGNVVIGVRGDPFGSISEDVRMKILVYDSPIQKLLDDRGAGNRAIFLDRRTPTK